jgi:tetratricopeptide (TPR) repeat protein
MKHLNKIFLSLTLICFSLSYSSTVYSQSNNESGKKITYKKARALQASTAKRMALVFEAYERLDDEGKEDPDMVTVRRVLTELRAEISELRSYDRSVVWYQWGFLYLQDEDVDSAIKAFLSVINEPEVTKSYRESGLLTLAQLSLSQEKYDQAIEYIMQWMSEVDKVTAQSWSFLGIAYFSKENYQK